MPYCSAQRCVDAHAYNMSQVQVVETAAAAEAVATRADIYPDHIREERLSLTEGSL